MTWNLARGTSKSWRHIRAHASSTRRTACIKGEDFSRYQFCILSVRDMRCDAKANITRIARSYLKSAVVVRKSTGYADQFSTQFLQGHAKETQTISHDLTC